MTLPPTDIAVLARRHDVRDRRANNMQTALDALSNCVNDLCAFACEPAILPGVAYSVADRLSRLIVELEGFKARDLISMRQTLVTE